MFDNKLQYIYECIFIFYLNQGHSLPDLKLIFKLFILQFKKLKLLFSCHEI